MGGNTKSEAVAQLIRRRVLSGDYPRGARLRQDELAAEFAVSITPVREALSVLQSEGLLIAEPHRGVRVADNIDVDIIRGAYVLRRLSETFAARKAVHRLSPHDLDGLERMLDDADRDTDRPDRVHAANREFHFAFYRRCDLLSLTTQIERMWAAFPWDLMLNDPARRAESRTEHRQILRSARTGDPDLVVAAFEHHLAGGMAAICRKITGDSGVDPFDSP